MPSDKRRSSFRLPFRRERLPDDSVVQAATALGVSQGTPVVVGGHDQACGALGAGVIEAGRVSDSMGTYECLVAASDEPKLGDKSFAARLNSYSHVVPGKFLTLAYFPSGIMVQWFRDLLHRRERARKGFRGRGERARCNFRGAEAECTVLPRDFS